MSDSTLNFDDMPHLDNGMLNLQELIRLMAQALINEILDAMADEMCGENNSRNGYRIRKLLTQVGTLTLKIPKFRIGSFFPEDVLVRWSRQDQALIACVSEMVVSGVSTRKIDKIAKTLGIEHISKSQVSRMCENLDSCVKELLEKNFDTTSFVYLWLDATYIKCRCDGRVASVALVSCIGLDSDGYRQVVGFDVFDTESYESWKQFLLGLRSRGINNIKCVVSDAHTGLKRAIQEVFCGASWQRCIVHFMRSVAAVATTKRTKQAVLAILSSVFVQTDPTLVKELYHQAMDIFDKIAPKAAKALEEAEADVLCYLSFPASHRKRLRTNNVQERTNRELKRRTRVIQVFPSIESLIRMVGALYCELDQNWQERRWFKDVAKTAEKESVLEDEVIQTKARHIIDLVLLEQDITIDKVA